MKEWKKFYKLFSAEQVGNEYQFFNHSTQRMESYDSLCMAEVLLSRFNITIIGHINKRKVGKMVEIPLKERLKQSIKSIPGKITQENFDKGLATFDKGMADFNKSMEQLNKGLGGKGEKPKLYSKKKSNNVEILMGKKKPVQKRKTKKKSKSDTWDENEKRLEKIWGKKK